jgi:hypothetical protein
MNEPTTPARPVPSAAIGNYRWVICALLLFVVKPMQ